MARVREKIALVTGGGRGIGEATARLLAAEGAFVIVVDVRDELGRAVVADIGDRASYHHLDVSRESEWKSLASAIRERHGRLDIVFNNAGISGLDPMFQSRPQDVEHGSLEDWHAIHAVNLDGVFLGCKYGITLMKEHGGSIINMSSRSGMVGAGGDAPYCSSKGAVRNFTKSVAMHCAENGYRIRCNSLHPGAIYTPIWDPALGRTPEERESVKQFVRRGIPLGELGTPMDVAYNVLYLASDESKYLTGSEMVIDGGILAGSTASPPKPVAED
jgi:3(or 17)beta-hydroxysteroid dehydrogenase